MASDSFDSKFRTFFSARKSSEMARNSSDMAKSSSLTSLAQTIARPDNLNGENLIQIQSHRRRLNWTNVIDLHEAWSQFFVFLSDAY